MDSTYTDLANRALKLLESSNKYRILILLIGAPGSGKSTIAQRVVDILNQKHLEHNQQSKTKIKTEYKSKVNDHLNNYDEHAHIDIEDSEYIPTKQISQQGDLIIRGRGGDDTAIKISHNHSEKDLNSFAQVVPMDGFHLPRNILHKFKDPGNAIARRGSPFTFDSSLVVQLVENINETLDIPSDGINPLDIADSNIPNIHIPSFDHSEHDPKPFGTTINSNSRVLILEGLYLLLNEPVWNKISRTLNPNIKYEPIDPNQLKPTNPEISIQNNLKSIPIPQNKNHEFWKIIIDDNTMLYRVGKRHLNSGIVKTLKEGEDRVKLNDLPNGKLVYKESFKSDLNIVSIDDINESTPQ
ncbi:hypothetical protein BN7_3771 [Wickerhamomyces ciferrii]|uniref:Magnesium chelatase ChlI-like catalytic domain-containing protein n=1 Tax=Wickerhamomyces ciferrii (strain ATCC 14091 / BCRC 22168 / CBS 111 / JCM 3599 / NBRC 0793 / NRRL Y-1031 F-60-10) TaxID=1206466 RepID=K0KPX1_WICCF|nr:uncharacterized protein BN7_3771 [Wickerhamomyces ciferrii]CCH44212.1 hypothetical protein BN7_3771 [Wickerhamomyces ciferrii]